MNESKENYMFQLDEKFLDELGLQDMPAAQKDAFLKHIYDELELRVGTKLSEGLSEDQLTEFEKIIDRDQQTIQDWVRVHAPDYVNDPMFVRLQQATNLDAGNTGLLAEYAATKWLEINRPDYRDVVTNVLEELKKEITNSRDQLVES